MKKGVKGSELDNTLRLIKLGKGKGELRKLLGIKPSALANRLHRLKELGCIELIGKYGINYISSSHKHPKVTINQVHKKLNKRGHAYNITVLFPKEIDDLREKDKVQRELKQKRIEKLGFGSYQLKYKKNIVWINKNSLTIYSSNYYCSGDALISRFKALKEADNLIKYLKERFEFRGIYGIEVFREHYGLMFNKFAKWLLKQKRKMTVKDKGNKSILWVDDSMKDDIGLKEFEGKDAKKINDADNVFDSHDKTNWEETPERTIAERDKTNENIRKLSEENLKTAQQSKKNAENLDYHAENMRSHVGAVKELGAGVRELTKIIKELKEAGNK